MQEHSLSGNRSTVTMVWPMALLTLHVYSPKSSLRTSAMVMVVVSPPSAPKQHSCAIVSHFLVTDCSETPRNVGRNAHRPKLTMFKKSQSVFGNKGDTC